MKKANTSVRIDYSACYHVYETIVGEGNTKPKQRKACANCSCGKKEEETLLEKAMAASNGATAVTVDTTKSKSSCGNVGLVVL